MTLHPVVRTFRSAWLMAFVLFVAGMFLYTAHNNFPFYYHPDEKGKVGQIAQHSRNCHHPLMMLSATEVVTMFHWGPLTSQEIVQKGRGVSAFFASMAVVAMALLARRMAGAVGGPLAAVLGGWSAGALTLSDSLLFDLAHYMKEDTALAMGLALTFLALHIFWKRRDELSVVFVGLAAATAVSGKYVGWLLFPFVLWMVHAGVEPAARKRYLKLFLKSFGLVFIILNYSLLLDPFKPFVSLKNEMTGVTVGHKGLTKSVPHADYVRMFLALPLAITSLFGVYIAGLLVRFKKVTPSEWLVPGFSLLLLMIMSFSPKSTSRYFLPVEMAVCFGAGLGVVWLASAVAGVCGRLRPAVLAVGWMLLFAAAFWNVKPVLIDHYQAMAVDDRVELRAWIASHLPASSVIAEDDRVHLLVRDEQKSAGVESVPLRILEGEKGFAAELGTLKQLRSQGVTHVATVAAKCMQFDEFEPTTGIKDAFLRRKAFYASLGLLKNSTPAPGVRQIWKSEIGINTYLQPGITLFDITGVAADPTTASR